MPASNKKSEKSNKSRKTNYAGKARETYYDFVGKEATKRVGKCPQIKGAVHEIILRDKINLTPKNMLNGKSCRLTKSTRSTSSDMVIMKGKKITSRIQAKDLTNSSSINDFKRKIESKQYKNSKIMVTEETKELLKKAKFKSGKSISSSGISSKTTTRIADNQGVKLPNKSVLNNNLKDISNQAVNAAAVSVAIEAGVAAVQNFNDLKEGYISGQEFTLKVAKTAAKSSVKAGGKTASALLIKEGGKMVAKSIGKEGLKKAAGSNAATGVAFGLVEQGLDTIKLASGEIDSSTYAKKTIENVGSTGGAIGGAMYGAALGSVIPIVGTAIGAAVGGLIGGIGGGGIANGFCSLFDWWD